MLMKNWRSLVAKDNAKVKHKPVVPFDYGTLRQDAATFYVNNKIFEGFKNIKITRNLLAISGSFSVTTADKWRVGQANFEILPEDRVHCHLGKHAIFEGWVDKLNLAITEASRNITIQGRDRTGDLVTCSITNAAEFNNLDFAGIAAELCKPFNIKVLVQADVGAKFPKFSVRQGETVFEALERAAKERQLLLLSSTHGNLIITKKGSKRAVSALVEGVNCRVSTAGFDHSERFSEYIVKGQSTGLLGTPKDATQNKGAAIDNGVKRYRPTVIIAENAVDNDGAQSRAEWESSYRAAKSSAVSVVVVGWSQEDGSLWDVNMLVQLDARSVGVKSQMLIEKVIFEQANDGGRTVELSLIRPDALDFKKEIKKEDDILSSLGWKES